MTYIEPVKLHVRTANENLTPVLSEDSIGVSNWPDQHNYVLDQIIDGNYNLIRNQTVKEEFRTVLEEMFENIYSIDDEMGRRAKQVMEVGFERSASNLMIMNKPNLSIFTSETPGLIYMVSQDREPVDTELERFHGKLSNFAPIASDFGLKIELLSGPDFAKHMSKSLDSDVESREDFDNEFEESINSEISNQITRGIDANVTLKFGDDDPEVFEYDMLVHATGEKRIVLEVKDESHEEADLKKAKLIDRPRDKTNIIGSQEESARRSPFQNIEQTETFVVVKDMDSDKMEQHRQKAERRDVNLLSYNEGEYIKELEQVFKNMVYAEL